MGRGAGTAAIKSGPKWVCYPPEAGVLLRSVRIWLGMPGQIRTLQEEARSRPPFIARRWPAPGKRRGLRARRFERSLSLAQTPSGRHDFGNAQPELLVDHHDLAARNALAVHQQVDGLAGQAVQAHDRARAEAQRLADGHLGETDLN